MPTLLVVDDEPNVLYSLERALASDDLEVLTASTGKHGVELAQRRRPDAVLLDLRLTDMTGLEAFVTIVGNDGIGIPRRGIAMIGNMTRRRFPAAEHGSDHGAARVQHGALQGRCRRLRTHRCRKDNDEK